MHGKTFFGFGMADNMFPTYCNLSRKPLTVDAARELLMNESVVSCLNPSHKLTIDVMENRFNVRVAIPEKAINVKLETGDRLVVMAVSGLPRLVDRHEYTTEEIAGAKFQFALWNVMDASAPLD